MSLFVVARELLEKAGFTQVGAITTPDGYWKSQDVARWQVFAVAPNETGLSHFVCWQTLTEFCRNARKYGVDHYTEGPKGYGCTVGVETIFSEEPSKHVNDPDCVFNESCDQPYCCNGYRDDCIYFETTDEFES